MKANFYTVKDYGEVSTPLFGFDSFRYNYCDKRWAKRSEYKEKGLYITIYFFRRQFTLHFWRKVK